MRAQNQAAFVMRTQPYSESSLLTEILSREYGRFGVLAKGARRLKSPARGLLMPFRPLLLSWSGRGELSVLSGAEAAAPAVQLRGVMLACGFYMNELILRLLHRNDPHPALFEAYHTGLLSLEADDNAERPLRMFEKRLLKELGYALVLDHEVESDRPIEPDLRYNYILERGPVPLRRGTGGNLSIRGSTLLQLAQDQLTDKQCLHESKRLLRAILSYHLDERMLNSRRFMQRVDGNVNSERPAYEAAS